MRDLRGSRKIPGEKEIYSAGEKEYIAKKKREHEGIPLNKSLQDDIIIMKKDLGLDQYSFSFS
jgi:LDH2 family malate/lactate/ureidoglycolate dehydrogenase